MINPEAYDTDAELERRIAEQADRLGDAGTDAEKISAWHELRRLHALRSPEQIEHMERERGLR